MGEPMAEWLVWREHDPDGARRFGGVDARGAAIARLRWVDDEFRGGGGRFVVARSDARGRIVGSSRWVFAITLSVDLIGGTGETPAAAGEEVSGG